MATNVPPETADILKIKSSQKSSNFQVPLCGKIWLQLELPRRSFEGLESTHVSTTGHGVVGDLYNSVHSR